MKASGLILFFLIQLTCKAQYRKMMLDSNHYYREYYSFNPPLVPMAACNCEVQTSYVKDTIINLKTYKKIKNVYFHSSPISYCYGTGAAPGIYYFRDDTILKRLIILNNNQEKIYYDFNKNVGDTAMLIGAFTITITSKDSILFTDGKYHKRFIGGNGAYTYIEGLGGAYGFLHPFLYTGNGSTHSLICFSKKDANTSLFPIVPNGACNFVYVDTDHLTNEVKQFKIYPNPVNDKLNINFKYVAKREIEVFNNFGVKIITLLTEELNSSLNLEKCPVGIYSVSVLEDNTKYYLKLIIQ
jgi:hypothetical protein